MEVCLRMLGIISSLVTFAHEAAGAVEKREARVVLVRRSGCAIALLERCRVCGVLVDILVLVGWSSEVLCC